MHSFLPKFSLVACGTLFVLYASGYISILIR
jgi:hypothetical protein